MRIHIHICIWTHTHQDIYTHIQRSTYDIYMAIQTRVCKKSWGSYLELRKWQQQLLLAMGTIKFVLTIWHPKHFCPEGYIESRDYLVTDKDNIFQIVLFHMVCYFAPIKKKKLKWQILPIFEWKSKKSQGTFSLVNFCLLFLVNWYSLPWQVN